ncbi:GNAT family N-acetyltransferase [Plantactinospora siamensis]|uniref:GNAT family N-acetyltransferase n=1 Tax=Plantactinospora siamensis TaxID=555372 RepID=A0ABV6P3J4_9ACTN
MIHIDVATPADTGAFLASAVALVATDAARYDPDATDVTWSERTGQAYAAGALSGDNVVLLAREDDRVVGHLVGRLSGPGSVHPVRVAELESLYVEPGSRAAGTGSRLVEAFLAWAAEHGADRATVTAYAANERALAFYARHGFAVRSVTLDRAVGPPRA